MPLSVSFSVFEIQAKWFTLKGSKVVSVQSVRKISARGVLHLPAPSFSGRKPL